MVVFSKGLLIAGLAWLLLSFIKFALALIPSRWRSNPAPALGKAGSGIAYSFTGAMSPSKKESAYMHLPTYTAGLIFHIGLFSAILFLFIMLIGTSLPDWLSKVFLVVFAAGSLCGSGILIKRIFSPILKSISNADDFISNIMVTGFQLVSALVAWNTDFIDVLFIYSFVLAVYIPLGKLRHSFYFFSSRIALGIYYGTRGVWNKKSDLL
jgi:hypothetical protein